MKPDRLQMRKALMMRDLLRSNSTSVRDAVIELENIKAEGFWFSTGTHAGTQLDQLKSDSTQPHTATSSAVPLHFLGESKGRPPPPQRQYSQTSVVDRGRQSRQASTPAASVLLLQLLAGTPLLRLIQDVILLLQLLFKVVQ